MMKSILTCAAASLLALDTAAPAQSGARNPAPPRSGLDISGIESLPDSNAPRAKSEKRPTGPVEITAHEATYDNRTNIAIFSNEVVVKHPEFGLSSDRLTVTIKSTFLKNMDQPDGKAKPAEEKNKAPAEKPKSNEGALEKVVAEGHVIMTQDKLDGNGMPQRYTGKAARAVYESKTDTLKLYGWPQISQSIGGNISKQIVAREESCVIILDRAGKIEVKGYHTSTLQDTANLNQNPR